MFLVGIISWWYSGGWKSQLRRIHDRLTGTAGYFSIGQLLSTMFSPFRQISAGRTNGPVGAQLSAFFDKTLSRVIGAVIRSFTILFGVIVMVVQSIAELIVLLVWLILPLVPIVGIIMFAVGWVPSWM
jgi:hypothetical protein